MSEEVKKKLHRKKEINILKSLDSVFYIKTINNFVTLRFRASSSSYVTYTNTCAKFRKTVLVLVPHVSQKLSNADFSVLLCRFL